MLNNKIISRLFTTLIILFFATPFIILAYGQYQASLIGLNIQTLLEESIQFNLLFIIGFFTPFISLYMVQLKKEFENHGETEKTLINLSLIALIFLMMGNAGYALFLTILIYFMLKNSKIRFIDLVEYIQPKEIFNKKQLPILVFFMISILIRIAITKANVGI